MSGKRFRKSLSVVLTLCLLAGMIPDAAFAEEEAEAPRKIKRIAVLKKNILYK